MGVEPVTVLLVMDQPSQVHAIQTLLDSTLEQQFTLTHVSQLSDALDSLRHETFHVILLALKTPDDALSAVADLRRAAPCVPVVVLQAGADDEYALRIIQAGAQDCLDTRTVQAYSLIRTLRLAIARAQVPGSMPVPLFSSQALLDDLPYGVIILDSAGRPVFSNKAGLLMTREHATWMSPFIASDSVTQIMDATGNALAASMTPGGRALDGEVIHRQRYRVQQSNHREEVLLDVSAAPVRDSMGAITGAIVVFIDVTQEQHLVKTMGMLLDELLSSEARYRTLVEQLPVTVYKSEPHVPYADTYISPHIETLLGFTPLEWLAKSDRWREQIHPDDREYIVHAVLTAFAASEPYKLDYRMITRDGSIVWVSDEARIVTSDRGQPTFMQGVLLDITARKQAEEAQHRRAQVQRILASLTLLATATLDAETMLPRLCREAAVAFNLYNASVFLLEDHATLRFAVSAQPDAAVGARFPMDTPYFVAGRAVMERRALYDNRYATRPLPDILDALARAYTPIKSVLAAPIAIGDEIVGSLTLTSEQHDRFGDDDLAAVTDIADVVGRALHNAQLYAREQDLAAQMRRIEHWRTALLRMMSHEVRTPLGQILGFTELLTGEAGNLGDRARRYLDNVQIAATRLNIVVQRSLDLLRLHAEDVAFAREPVDVDDLVGTAIAGQQSFAASRGIALHSTSAMPRMEVSGDRQLLHQALDILLENAVKVTPRGGHVNVTVEPRLASVEIGVRDGGKGVSQEVRDAVLVGEADDLLDRQHSEAELSLLMARRIAELHSGMLQWTEADEDRTGFILLLPRPDEKQRTVHNRA